MRGCHEDSGSRTRTSAAGHARDLSSDGVTALELLLVLSIAAVITAIALPQAMSGVKSYHLHSDTTSLASYLNLTRMRAAAQYAPYSLDLDPTTNTYVL